MYVCFGRIMFFFLLVSRCMMHPIKERKEKKMKPNNERLRIFFSLHFDHHHES